MTMKKITISDHRKVKNVVASITWAPSVEGDEDWGWSRVLRL